MRCVLLLIPVLICLGSACSAAAVTLRDEVFVTRDTGRVVFSHTAHLKQREMRSNCRACHETLFSLNRGKRHTMAEMRGGRSCGACHDGRKAFGVDACSRCHQVQDRTYRSAAAGTVRFRHGQHITRIPDCGACHPSPYSTAHRKQVTMAAMQQGRSCGACHNGKRAFGVDRCLKCHNVKDRTYAVPDVGPVLFRHEKHLSRYGCRECHPERYRLKRSPLEVTMAEMEKGRSCGGCHDGRRVFSVSGRCENCHAM